MAGKIRTLGHVGMGTGELSPFDQVYDEGKHVTPEDILAGKVDALVIWGGADISPSIYNQPVGPRTGADANLSHRDRVEVAVCKAAISAGIPIIGVCRGAQLLCALAGGILVQDVDGHIGSHSMTTDTGRTIITSSVHHQMMYPFHLEESDYDLIAWTTQARSHSYVGVDSDKMKMLGSVIEPEVIFFHSINGLAIQGHPEFMKANDEFVLYCNDLVREYFA
jgi:anthranilate/para-aminobenzoate synthase component II